MTLTVRSNWPRASQIHRRSKLKPGLTLPAKRKLLMLTQVEVPAMKTKRRPTVMRKKSTKFRRVTPTAWSIRWPLASAQESITLLKVVTLLVLT